MDSREVHAHKEMGMEQELFEAKARLYGLLLKKGGTKWTADEIDIAYHLSMDKQIQAHLQANLRPTLSAEN